MGRRSLHTADELRELIIDASTDLIREAGMEGLSARAIARRIDYSPGTIYNSFENLDDLVLTIEGRLLDNLSEQLSRLPETDDPLQLVRDIAARYLDFVSANPRLWNLLFEHHLPNALPVPDWYRAKLEAPIKMIEDALRPVAGGLSSEEISRAARVLWAAMHGIASLSTAHKLSVATEGQARPMLDDLVRSYLAGRLQTADV